MPERIIRTSGLLKECSEKGIDVWITGCDPTVTYSGMAGLEGVNILPMMTETCHWYPNPSEGICPRDRKYVESNVS
ncbi:MAG: hypothetical protein SPJ57_03830 [Candidatus Methanomethylophilaceae archaeon]|nr:hypothetical protein [Candidatus Methanomethylophilaceae archaeon]